MPRLFVLDAMGLAYRAFHALARRVKDAGAEGGIRYEGLSTAAGQPTWAVFALANTVLKIRREQEPTHWALAWDGPGPTFRHERFPDYKATRRPMPPEFLEQIPAIEDLAQAIGLPVLEVPGTEADDVMATLARRGEREGFEVVLVTSDKDLLQLVDDRVRLLSPAGRGENYVWVDRAAVHEKWGVAPEQIRDVLALMGDSSDNVPGVPGIGEKTAVELIRQFGTLDALYAGLEQVARAGVREKLRVHRAQALLSRELVTVRDDLDLPYAWDDLRCAPIRREALRAFARRLEIGRLERVADELGVDEEQAGAQAPGRSAERRGTAAETPAPGVRLAGDRPPRRDLGEPGSGTVVPAPAAGGQGTLELWGGATAAEAAPLAAGAGLEAFEARIHAVRARALHGLALLPVAEGPEPRRATLVGLALAARDGTCCYVPLAHAHGPNVPLERARGWLAPALADALVEKVGEDLKRDAHLLGAAGMPLGGLAFDVHLGSFLLDPQRDHGLDALARDVLGVTLPPVEPAAARGRPRPGPAVLEPAAAAAAAEARVAALLPLHQALRAQLEAREQWRLYTGLEHPLIEVLREIEATGVALDRAVLAEMSTRAATEIARLEEELHRLAGEPVNLNSGPQLARVLFETLGLKTGRRTKTGFSTDQAVLEELAASHPFPARLLEYRVLSKLRSTYFDALPQAVDPLDGRVHTTFEQAGAATGRLSSSNPNLQNIPMRSEQGRAIRRAFVAAPGAVLVGADYSQIELRVMAHLSGDPNLIEAFTSGEDVHASTARRIFGVPAGELDPALRSRAKVVNFGVMYGMGARSLSRQMGIGLDEAQAFIRDYFRIYARVREYLDQTVVDARRRGFVETALGRRRYLPDLAASGARAALAERAAINTPIQGTAADIMKLAMVRVHHGLKRTRASARLLLQVHDELLLECPTGAADEVSGLVRSAMEGCFPLLVPLRVSLGRGPTWFDAHS